MNNKPKYSLFKNAKYSLEGLIHAIKTETSFKIELFFLVVLIVLLSILELTSINKLFLIVTFFIILIAELLNSAIENVVDLVTTEIHPLAKNAKDIAATAVLFSVILHLLCWLIVLVG